MIALDDVRPATALPPPRDGLRARWHALRALSERPPRIRDAAELLGVSELELLLATDGEAALHGARLCHLTPAFPELVRALPEVGACMALTRNPHAVLEVHGRYGGVQLGPHAGQVIGDGIDLRVFLSRWRYAVTLTGPSPRGGQPERRSLQIFDAAGAAVHKLYLEPEQDPTRWDELVAELAAPAPRELALTAPPPPPAERVLDRADRDAFCVAWEGMTDTHELFGLLREHRLGRVQALRAVWPKRARPVTPESLQLLLTEAARAALRIMIFVGNPGCIQIYSGPVVKVARHGQWLNVLDPQCNLHVLEPGIASAWVVHKPTRTGRVSSLELYDARGDTIAMVFRKRADGDPAEDPRWSELLAALPEAELPTIGAQAP